MRTSYFVLRGLSLALQLVPVRVALMFGTAIGRLAHLCLPWRRRIVNFNLRLTSGALLLPALPPESKGIDGTCSDSHTEDDGVDSIDDRTLCHVERAAYEHLGRVLMLSLQPPHLTLSLLSHAFTGATLAELHADCAMGGVIVCSCHFGAWELLPMALVPLLTERARRHGALVYRPLHDSSLDRWLRRRRMRGAGMALLPDRGSLPRLRKLLNRGGVVGLLGDQRPAPGRSTATVTLMGESCEASIGIGDLHATTGAPVWFATMTLDYVDSVHRPVLNLCLKKLAGRCVLPRGHSEPSSAVAADVVVAAAAPGTVRGPGVSRGREGLHQVQHRVLQAYADAVTAAVRTTPAQYFWFHDRWKAKRERGPMEGAFPVFSLSSG
jgi:lauroyl/myristoyl acyltransferase